MSWWDKVLKPIAKDAGDAAATAATESAKASVIAGYQAALQKLLGTKGDAATVKAVKALYDFLGAWLAAQ